MPASHYTKAVSNQNTNFDKTIHTWEENAKIWHFIKPPLRPSADDIRAYEKLAGKALSGKILVLGATPELRNLISGHGGRKTVVDSNGAMLKRMDEFLHDKTNEIIIQSDWLKINLPENFFDVIVADMIWWLLPLEAQKNLAKKISSWLHKDGIFISRFRVWNISRKNENPSEIIQNYLNKLRRTPGKKSEIRNNLMLHLTDIVSDPSTMQTDREKVIAVLLKTSEFLENQNDKSFLIESAAPWKGKPNLTYQTREQILKSFEGRLKQKGEAYGGDYEESKLYPILRFQKL